MMATSRRRDGFTLLEVLVVLVITSLVSVLIIQGFQQVLDLRFRYLRALDEQSATFMEHQWFSELCRSIVPDFSAGEHFFKGDEDEMSGLTLAPLNGYMGVPVFFTLSLERKDRVYNLMYEDELLEEPLVLASFDNDNVRFQYVTEEQRVVRHWPPMGQASNSLPENIMLNMRDRGEQFFWAARVDSRKIDWDDRLPVLMGATF